MVDRGLALDMDRCVLRLDIPADTDRAAIAGRVKDAVGVTPEIVPRDDIYPAGDTMKSRRVLNLRST